VSGRSWCLSGPPSLRRGELTVYHAQVVVFYFHGEESRFIALRE
jgi:hypothetical protein